jgi:hypothetical protein
MVTKLPVLTSIRANKSKKDNKWNLLYIQLPKLMKKYKSYLLKTSSMSKKLWCSLAFISVVVITLLLYWRSRLCSNIYALGGLVDRNSQAMGRLLVYFSKSLPSDSNWLLLHRCHNSFISSCYFCWHLFTIIRDVSTNTLTTLGFLNMYNTISICISNWLRAQK